MAVCFFNRNYENKYYCEYEIIEGVMKIFVDYDISVENEQGVLVGSSTDFESRDILIIDHKNRINYLLIDAYYAGINSIWGTPDGREKTIFKTSKYLCHERYDILSEVKKDFKIKSIRIYSELVNELYGRPSVKVRETQDEFLINLKIKPQGKCKEVSKNDFNIEKILINDTWNTFGLNTKNIITINITGYIEVMFSEDVELQYINEYIMELIMYLHLYCPNKVKIDKMKIKVEDRYFELRIPIRETKYRDKKVKRSVDEDVLEFLEKCYLLIPYRKNKNSTRNVYNIVLNTNRNLEDNFLMLYRFVECYYKEKGNNNTFISEAIKNNYKEPLNRDVVDITAEMCSLRNHYTHEGYHIAEGKLAINYKGDPSKNYIAENVDFDWIYERTEILYNIVIDIIFSSMLGYDKYKFDKSFAES